MIRNRIIFVVKPPSAQRHHSSPFLFTHSGKKSFESFFERQFFLKKNQNPGNFLEMPQCFPFNIQLSIGTAISAIPYQLLITFGTYPSSHQISVRIRRPSVEIFTFSRPTRSLPLYIHYHMNTSRHALYILSILYISLSTYSISLSLSLPSHQNVRGYAGAPQSTIHTYTTKQHTDIALFAAVAGLVSDREFNDCEDVVLGCVRRVPVFAIALFSVHSFVCLVLLLSKLRSEYDLIVFTTDSKQRQRYAFLKEILSGVGFDFCLLFLLKTVCVLYALLPDTSYAVKSIPIYLLLLFLTFTFVLNILGSSDTFASNDPIFVAYYYPGSHLFVSLNHRASDDFVETRWSFQFTMGLIFILYWLVSS